jgi:NAD(P)-dependent dehydrogenase (short-subunit alcohol dehydrogenase family)
MSNLSGKIAVITGGNSGIGYATAKDFIAQGATVVITGRNKERVEKAAAELGATGLVADQSKLSDTEKLVEEVKAAHRKIDVLFINAGVFFGTSVGQIEEDTFDTLMDINFKGAVFTLEKFVPILNDGASVINLSSINAYTGMPTTAIYGASKAALNSYTRTAAKELAQRNIRVNAVNPGPVNTPIFGKTGMSEEQIEGFAATLKKEIPLGHFGTPESIAKLVTFLASDDASFITGSEINIDGGSNLHSLV